MVTKIKKLVGIKRMWSHVILDVIACYITEGIHDNDLLAISNVLKFMVEYPMALQNRFSYVGRTDEADVRANLEAHGAIIGIRTWLNHLSRLGSQARTDRGHLHSLKLIHDT